MLNVSWKVTLSQMFVSEKAFRVGWKCLKMADFQCFMTVVVK